MCRSETAQKLPFYHFLSYREPPSLCCGREGFNTRINFGARCEMSSSGPRCFWIQFPKENKTIYFPDFFHANCFIPLSIFFPREVNSSRAKDNYGRYQPEYIGLSNTCQTGHLPSPSPLLQNKKCLLREEAFINVTLQKPCCRITYFICISTKRAQHD